MGSVDQTTNLGHEMRKHFLFESEWTNLNHGSFGTYPRQVRDALRGFQDQNEAAPDRYIKYKAVELLDESRKRVAETVNAPMDECVFVLNATTGVNTVLRNLTYKEKDAIIYFDTIYSSCERILMSLNETSPQVHLRAVRHSPDRAYVLPCTHTDIVDAFVDTISALIGEGYTPKVAIFDTIVSIPGIRFPFEKLVSICKAHNIYSMVDAAHSLGQIPLDLSSLDPDFFVANCHKWLYTPRGCALFYVPKRNQHLIRTTFPTSIGFKPLTPSSKVYNFFPHSTKSDFVILFEYIGTSDDSAYYCVPAALDFREAVCGGNQKIYDYIRNVVQEGADVMARMLGTRVMDDVDRNKGASDWSGGLRDCAMANILLPLSIVDDTTPQTSALASKEAANEEEVSTTDNPGEETMFQVRIKRTEVGYHIHWMLRQLVDRFNTNVQIFEYDTKIWTRVSGQIYLELSDFEWLGEVFKTLCREIQTRDSFESQQDGTKTKVNTKADPNIHKEMATLQIDADH